MTYYRSPIAFAFLATIALVGIGAASATAEPYLAVRTGFKCSQCHVSPTGGGKRTPFGVLYSQTNLAMTHFRPTGEPGFFSGRIVDRVSVGGNFRADYLTLFQVDDARGNLVPAESDASVSQATVYLQVDVVEDKLTVYLDQLVAPTGLNRELYAMVHGMPLGAYAKVGRILLPYGFRLLDDDAFIRNRTGYTYDRHAPGIELGMEPGPLSLIANATEDQLSVTGSTVFRRFRVGASYGEDLNLSSRSVRGVFAGVNLGRITLLGEGDWITEGSLERFAAIAELDFLLTRGMNVKLTYELFDRDRSTPSSQNHERLTVGIEPFVTQFLQVGVFYRMNRGAQTVSESRDRLLVQLHAFF